MTLCEECAIIESMRDGLERFNLAPKLMIQASFTVNGGTELDRLVADLLNLEANEGEVGIANSIFNVRTSIIRDKKIK